MAISSSWPEGHMYGPKKANRSSSCTAWSLSPIAPTSCLHNTYIYMIIIYIYGLRYTWGNEPTHTHTQISWQFPGWMEPGSFPGSRIRECWEEARVPSEMASRASPAGVVSYVQEDETGRRPQGGRGTIEGYTPGGVTWVLRYEIHRCTQKIGLHGYLMILEFI